MLGQVGSPLREVEHEQAVTESAGPKAVPKLCFDHSVTHLRVVERRRVFTGISPRLDARRRRPDPRERPKVVPRRFGTGILELRRERIPDGWKPWLLGHQRIVVPRRALGCPAVRERARPRVDPSRAAPSQPFPPSQRAHRAARRKRGTTSTSTASSCQRKGKSPGSRPTCPFSATQIMYGSPPSRSSSARESVSPTSQVPARGVGDRR